MEERGEYLHVVAQVVLCMQQSSHQEIRDTPGLEKENKQNKEKQKEETDGSCNGKNKVSSREMIYLR